MYCDYDLFSKMNKIEEDLIDLEKYCQLYDRKAYPAIRIFTKRFGDLITKYAIVDQKLNDFSKNLVQN